MPRWWGAFEGGGDCFAKVVGGVRGGRHSQPQGIALRSHGVTLSGCGGFVGCAGPCATARLTLVAQLT